MSNPKRCTIFIPSDGSLYERMDDPNGQWIFDPDHKINVCRFCEGETQQGQYTRPDKCSAESHALKRMGGYSICPVCDENISGG